MFGQLEILLAMSAQDVGLDDLPIIEDELRRLISEAKRLGAERFRSEVIESAEAIAMELREPQVADPENFALKPPLATAFHNLGCAIGAYGIVQQDADAIEEGLKILGWGWDQAAGCSDDLGLRPIALNMGQLQVSLVRISSTDVPEEKTRERMEAATAWLELAHELAEKHELRLAQGKALHALGELCVAAISIWDDETRLDAAIDHFERAAQAYAGCGNRVGESWARARQGEVLVEKALATSDAERATTAKTLLTPTVSSLRDLGELTRARHAERQLLVAAMASVSLQEKEDGALEEQGLRELIALISGMIESVAAENRGFALACLAMTKASLAWIGFGQDLKRSAELLDEAVACAEEAGDVSLACEARSCREQLTALRVRIEPIAKVDRAANSVSQSGGGPTTDEGPVPHEEGTSSTPSALRDDFTQASLGDLIATCQAHGVPDAALQRLKALAGEQGASGAPSRDFSSASLDDLVATLEEGSNVPPAGLVDRLAQVVRAARHSPPADRMTWRDKVNALLDRYNLNFVLGDGRTARMAVAPARENGSLVFGLSPRGSASFLKNEFEIHAKSMQEITLDTSPG